MKMVKVLNPDTKEVATIPVAELAPGMICVRVGDTNEVYYVEADKIKKKPGLRHPAFEEEDRRIIRGIMATFHDVHPRSFQQWEDGFRYDMNPKKEIGLWLLMGHCFLHFTRGRSLNFEKRKNIFDVILATVNNGPDAVSSTVVAHTLSRKRLHEIVDYVVSEHPMGKEHIGDWMDEVIEQADGEQPPNER